MADNANTSCDEPGTGSGKLAQQRISGILQAVLDDEMAGKENNRRARRYPWYIDGVLALGLLLAVGGFTIGMFKLYLSHVSKQCLENGDYQAAITLLKENPLPSFINLTGQQEDDPDELLARALYLDAMQKMDNNDAKGGLSELTQIRAGTREFDTAQKILADNFQPSPTQLTGGIVEDVADNKPAR